MTLHVPALPAGVETGLADAAAEAEIARRRRRLETMLAVTATMFAVLAVSAANVALELIR
jgi:hypothetical protein